MKVSFNCESQSTCVEVSVKCEVKCEKVSEKCVEVSGTLRNSLTRTKTRKTRFFGSCTSIQTLKTWSNRVFRYGYGFGYRKKRMLLLDQVRYPKNRTFLDLGSGTVLNKIGILYNMIKSFFFRFGFWYNFWILKQSRKPENLGVYGLIILFFCEPAVFGRISVQKTRDIKPIY